VVTGWRLTAMSIPNASLMIFELIMPFAGGISSIGQQRWLDRHHRW
jgi:hypothetical protein